MNINTGDQGCVPTGYPYPKPTQKSVGMGIYAYPYPYPQIMIHYTHTYKILTKSWVSLVGILSWIFEIDLMPLTDYGHLKTIIYSSLSLLIRY